MAVIDLSQLPAPQIVEMPDFEALIAERKAAFVALYPVAEQDAVRRTLELESEPITKLLQENTYREILLRQRIPPSMEGLSVAGPSAAYEFHARSADGRVADASAVSPSPANVTVTILSREGDGKAAADLLAAVAAALNDESVRPVADRVLVQSASIVNYTINAKLYLYPGPEAEPVKAAAIERLETYIKA